MPPEPTPLVTQPTQDPELEQAFPELQGSAAAPSSNGAEPPLEGEAELPVEELPELPEDWEKHPSIAERLKTTDTEAYNRAKSHLTRSHTATMVELETVHREELARTQDRATASQVVQQFAETIGNLSLDDAESIAAARKLLSTTDSWAKVFLGSQERDAQAALTTALTNDERWVKGLTDEAADEFNAAVSELSLKLRGQVAKAENREEVTRVYASTLGSYLEERDKHRDKVIITQALAKEQSRLEQLARKAAGLAPAGSPPARPPSGSGGATKTDAEILLDSRTSVAELANIIKRRESGDRR